MRTERTKTSEARSSLPSFGSRQNTKFAFAPLLAPVIGIENVVTLLEFAVVVAATRTGVGSVFQAGSFEAPAATKEDWEWKIAPREAFVTVVSHSISMLIAEGLNGRTKATVAAPTPPSGKERRPYRL